MRQPWGVLPFLLGITLFTSFTFTLYSYPGNGKVWLCGGVGTSYRHDYQLITETGFTCIHFKSFKLSLWSNFLPVFLSVYKMSELKTKLFSLTFTVFSSQWDFTPEKGKGNRLTKNLITPYTITRQPYPLKWVKTYCGFVSVCSKAKSELRTEHFESIQTIARVLLTYYLYRLLKNNITSRVNKRRGNAYDNDIFESNFYIFIRTKWRKLYIYNTVSLYPYNTRGKVRVNGMGKCIRIRVMAPCS